VFLGGPWFWSGWWGEAVEHEADHRYVNHRFVGLVQALVVAYQATPAQKPGDRVGVGPGRAAALSGRCVSPARPPNRTCTFPRIRLSTSPGWLLGHSVAVHGEGMLRPR
jgi:hypothetical protein